MFQNFTELIIDIPNPAKIKGTALLREDVKLFTLPKDNLNINENVSNGFFSWIIKIIVPITNAITNPIKNE